LDAIYYSILTVPFLLIILFLVKKKKLSALIASVIILLVTFILTSLLVYSTGASMVRIICTGALLSIVFGFWTYVFGKHLVQ